MIGPDVKETILILISNKNPLSRASGLCLLEWTWLVLALQVTSDTPNQVVFSLPRAPFGLGTHYLVERSGS